MDFQTLELHHQDSVTEFPVSFSIHLNKAFAIPLVLRGFPLTTQMCLHTSRVENESYSSLFVIRCNH
jgi:hypothetical protein